MTPPFPNSYWLEPDRILCGEYPRDFDDFEDHEGMTAILKAGVRVFVDLTEEGELKPYREIAVSTARDLGIDPEGLEFHRHPIRDVSVPKDTREMRGILRTIRLSRHRKKTVYLHCWGGRGRTGTVAACLLRDLLGLDGEGALLLLSKRWQDCAKSASSDSPEMEEQRGFVHAFDPVRSISEYCRSALLGAAVGDALGVPVEFRNRTALAADPVVDMREFGTHHQPAGTWSDDTSMILATMSAIVASGAYDPDSVMREFEWWMTQGKHTPHGEVFDIGNATRAAINRYRGGTAPLECGGRSEDSNGNGSLMRILPVALAWADDPDLIEKAAEISSLTHAHERSRYCCAFYCLVVSELLHGGSIEEAVGFAWDAMDSRWKFSAGERPLFDSLHPGTLLSRREDEIRSSGHVIDTIRASLWVNGRHDDYRETVLHAVNLGDDTDTTGCVAGGLAGLIHGQANIPENWRNVLMRRSELVELADRSAEFCLLQSDSLMRVIRES